MLQHQASPTKSFISSALLLLFVWINAYGQSKSNAKITGKIIDAATSKPVEYVSVGIFPGGTPRYIENPNQRTNDVCYAIDYLVTLPYVDENRIGILGVCGGGAYSLNIVMTERRIKEVVSITGVNFGRLLRDGFPGGAPMDVLDKVAGQRSAEAMGSDLLTINMLPESVGAGLAAGTKDIDVLEATDYHKTSRGYTPGGATSAVYSRLSTGMGWNAFHLCETLLTQPILVVIGDKPGGFGAYRDGYEVVRRAASTQKELFVVEGYSHYDQPEPTSQALAKAIPFFQTNL